MSKSIISSAQKIVNRALKQVCNEDKRLKVALALSCLPIGNCADACVERVGKLSALLAQALQSFGKFNHFHMLILELNVLKVLTRNKMFHIMK